MKLRDMVGFILFFFPAVILQCIAVQVCGPHGRKAIADAYRDAMKSQQLEKP